MAAKRIPTASKRKLSKPVNEKGRKQSLPTRLFRSEKDRVLGGVAGGLAQYFNLDSTLLRLVFVLLLVFGGSGLLIYIILWIIMPTQSSASANIEDNIRQNSEELRQKAEGVVDEVRTGQNTRQILGILILVFGVILLMQNFGYFHFFNLGRLWPLILIVLGIAILTRHGKK
jgi:phage shock protein C